MLLLCCCCCCCCYCTDNDPNFTNVASLEATNNLKVTNNSTLSNNIILKLFFSHTQPGSTEWVPLGGLGGIDNGVVYSSVFYEEISGQGKEEGMGEGGRGRELTTFFFQRKNLHMLLLGDCLTFMTQFRTQVFPSSFFAPPFLHCFFGIIF